MPYRLSVTYKDGTFIREAKVGTALEVVGELVERILDQEQHDHVQQWTISPDA